MPAYAISKLHSPAVGRKKYDYFQRRKVGSIRDNPKLQLIRQQFENASQTGFKVPTSSNRKIESAPCSINVSKSSNSSVLEDVLNTDSKSSEKFKRFLDNTHHRRHSEGDANGSRNLSVHVGDILFNWNKSDSASSKSKETFSNSTPNSFDLTRNLRFSHFEETQMKDRCKTESLSSESGVHTSSSTSEEEGFSIEAKICSRQSESKFSFQSPQIKHDTTFNASKDKISNDHYHKMSSLSKIRGAESLPCVHYQTLNFNKIESKNTSTKAPPIPKRGISPFIHNDFVYANINSSDSSYASVKTPKSSKTNDLPNSVKKAIEMYEGMSASDYKKRIKGSNSRENRLRREDSTSRKNRLHRRNSQKNSFRRSRILNEKTTHSTRTSTKPDFQSDRNDSGLALCDVEDRTENIYQTLTAIINVTKDFSDPYDRLVRLHDVVSRIHKGQISACAACKAIPSSVLEVKTNDSPIMEVKCPERSPHHHPPCICFQCQHSIFSCSLNSEFLNASESYDDDKDSLYYNVCCLNSPNREGWRQSRRRPVCEQNGRLCIVNCDMEKSHNSCSNMHETEDFYEKLSDCQSVKSETLPSQQNNKVLSGYSCDSEEDWMDVTDSEDEKPAKSQKNASQRKSSHSERYANINHPHDGNQPVEKTIDLLKCAISTEHLYESIEEIDSELSKLNTSDTEEPSASLADSIQNPEIELDSGEWSTESPSPTFDESTVRQDPKPSSQYSRFTVNIHNQEAAKKTFMDSVLGKKATNPKKKRSTFFVPNFLSLSEYGTKASLKKANSSDQMLSEKSVAECRSKRSQSIPLDSPPERKNFGSVEVLDEPNPELEDLVYDPPSLCSRKSTSSSAYLSSDQINSAKPKRKSSFPTEAPIDVSVDRICKLSSNNSEHSYIQFQPIKEEEVPLYQFYERNVKERVSFCRSPTSMSPIMWSSQPENSISEMGPKSNFTQRSVVEQLSPDAQDVKLLWCELPEVKESGILERISAQELKLQEALFEFIQSQASFVRSLKVLYESFILTSEFSDTDSASCVLSKHEHDVLFSDIIRVKKVSESLLREVTTRWSDSILIPDICDIIQEHATQSSFSVYVKYCSNRVYQERTLKELKESRLCFLEVLRKLESNPVCQGLSLESFLFLPMQHISRMPLLLDNIFRWLVPDSPFYGVCKSALEAVHKVFIECNEGARKMERLEEMFVLNKQLEFKECKVVPLISASRWLLKKGDVMKLEFDKKTFGRSSRCVRVPIHIFLFNDLLVITKKKNDDSYTVLDYCARDKLQAMHVNAKELQQPITVPNACRYLIYLTLFHNHQGNSVDMILSCSLMSERTRWIEAINNEVQNKPCEVWEYDCPQVQCVRSYIAQQPDELSLQESDVVTIHRKMNDGWYEGRRLRDGLQGWFPASYTMDIPCSRARASNLRQCYRLLMLSHPP